MATESKKPKHRGRAKGTPNKRTQHLLDKAEELGVDPFEVVLLFAKGDWRALGYKSEYQEKSAGGGATYKELTITPELRQKSAADACKYLYPQRKAVDVTSDGDKIPTAINFVEAKPKAKK